MIEGVYDSDDKFDRDLETGRLFEIWSAHCMNLFGQDVELVGDNVEDQKEYGDTYSGHEMKHDRQFHYTGRMAIEMRENVRGQGFVYDSGFQRPYIDHLVQGNVLAREFWVFPTERLKPHAQDMKAQGYTWKNSYSGTTTGVYLDSDNYRELACTWYKMLKHGNQWYLARKEPGSSADFMPYISSPKEEEVVVGASQEQDRLCLFEYGDDLRRRRQAFCDYNNEKLAEYDTD